MNTFLVNCIKDTYDKKGVDIKANLEDYENYLVSNGFFNQSLDSRYLTFFESMLRTNEFPSSVPKEIFQNISKVEIGRHLSKDCTIGIEVLDPRGFATIIKFRELGDQISSLTDSQNMPKEFASFFLENFTEAELQTEFTKMTILITIAWVSEINSSIFHNLPVLPPIKN